MTKNNTTATSINAIIGKFFSPDTTAGSVQQACPLTQVPSLPCNLKKLQLSEPGVKIKIGGIEYTRTVEFFKTGTRNRDCSPTLLRSNIDKFQVTAMSRSQKDRTVKTTVFYDSLCDILKHPTFTVSGPDLNEDGVSSEFEFHFHREEHPGDDSNWPLGICAILDAFYSAIQSPELYNITYMACTPEASRKF